MVDLADRNATGRADTVTPVRRSVPRWLVTVASIIVILMLLGDLRPRHQSDFRLLSERDL